MWEDEDRIKKVQREIWTRLKAQGYTLTHQKSRHGTFTDINGLPIKLSITRSWTRKQSRWKMHSKAPDNELFVVVKWGQDRDEWKQYKTLFPKFNYDHVLQRIIAFVTEKQIEYDDLQNEEITQAQIEAVCERIREQHGLKRSDRECRKRVRLMPSHVGGGIRLLVDNLTEAETHTLLTAIKGKLIDF